MKKLNNESKIKQEKSQAKRILGRTLARELTDAELREIAGAGYSCSNCEPDDCCMY